MAGGSGARGGRSGSRRDAAKRSASARSGGGAKKQSPTRPSKPRTPPATPSEPVVVGEFRLGAIPGATPGRWIDIWHERMPQAPLELVPLAVGEQRRALIDGVVDAALVRLPLDRDGLHVIGLYDEVPVVVSAADSHLTAADDLGLEDLVGEVVIRPLDDVLDIVVPGAVDPVFSSPTTTEEAIATVAAGVGVVIVPMSLARLHHRKDIAHRPLRDGPLSSVGLAWVAERTTPAVEAFVGIVRGRTANSSRG